MGAIDWAKSADEVACHIRAMQPWPTAYTFFHRRGKEPMRVMICDTVPFPIRSIPDAPPGTIFTDDKFPKSFFVLCGQAHSVLEILALQPAGKKRMTTSEFLRGYPIQDGYHFGPEPAA